MNMHIRKLAFRLFAVSVSLILVCVIFTGARMGRAMLWSNEVGCSLVENNITCSGTGTLTADHVQRAGVYNRYVHAVIEAGITEIASHAFKACSSLESVSFPEGLLTICEYCFDGTALRTVTIPSSVTSLYPTTFNWCLQLTHIFLLSQVYYKESDGLVYDLSGELYIVGAGRGAGSTLTLPDAGKILSNALRWNRAHHVIVSDATTEIQGNAFYNAAVKTLKLGKKVSTIASSAFSGTRIEKLEAVSNPNFYSENGCFGKLNTNTGAHTSLIWIDPSVSSVSIPTTVTTLIVGVLQNCNSLVKVEATGHASYQVICNKQLLANKYNGEFVLASYCVGGATSITVPSSITRIDKHCFRGCWNLHTLIFHSGVNYFGWSFARDCRNLTTVDFKGCTMSGERGSSTDLQPFLDCNVQTVVSWPSNDFIIDEDAFSGCGFVTLVLPDTAIALAKKSFWALKELQTLTISKSVTSIGDMAFNACPKLQSVTFASGSKLTTLSSMAFADCTSLATITLPHAITSLAGSCFAFDTSLTSILFDSNEGVYKSDGIAVYQSSESNTYHTLIICPGGVTSIRIPDSTNIIYSQAFYGCGHLSTVIMNQQLQRIEGNAFLECSSLEYIRIPATVSFIGQSVFVGCLNLKHVFYCNNRNQVSYEGDPLPASVQIFVFYDYTESTFCGQKCYPILDHECNLPTCTFTAGLDNPYPVKKTHMTVWPLVYITQCTE